MLAPFVDPDWVADRLDEVVVCDVRWYLDGRSGRVAYDRGHLPVGAPTRARPLETREDAVR